MLLTTRKGLDGKVAFETWVKHGTLKRAAFELQKLGYSFKGNPYSIMNIRRAALIWVITHPDEARPHYDAEQIERNMPPLTDDEWNEYLIRSAISAWRLQDKTFFEFIEKNGLWDYEHLWENKFKSND